MLELPGTMIRLNSDAEFNFQLLRIIAATPYQGADIGEVLVAATKIVPGDFESFYTVFHQLATRVHNAAVAIDSSLYPVSARNTLFRAASYYRMADFFLHGNWADPRIDKLWSHQLADFNAAMALLPTPGERVELQADGFKVPAIFFGTGLPGPRPTLLMHSGFDGSQEEIYHMIGEAALQRGINVITFEGPGQPAVRRQQGVGFTHEWEKAVTPVVDYALTRPEVDGRKIGLLGQSLGGYLAPRAAAFEHRLAAVIADDGLYSLGAALDKIWKPTDLTALHESGDAAAFNSAAATLAADPAASTMLRWTLTHGPWAFNVDSAFEFAARVPKYSLEGVLAKITCPVFVAEAQNDLPFAGDALRMVAELGARATYHLFENVDGAGEHCSLPARVLANQVMLDWFQGVVSSLSG
ncbi:2,6-dihydropseudooxynicotine hydrolase [Hypoxylon sp. NC1633]|nr:2,6-dihydropseudooxynicotine hydrolase [Hypoxylon sp. NC1633]